MKLDYQFIFFFGEIAALKIGAEVVNPPQSTALPAAEETGGFRKRTPTAFAVSSNISDEALVFFFGPRTFVCVRFFAAGRPTHLSSRKNNQKNRLKPSRGCGSAPPLVGVLVNNFFCFVVAENGGFPFRVAAGTLRPALLCNLGVPL